MLTPVVAISFVFTADGTSTAILFDLTTQPVALDLRGSRPVGLQSTSVTSSSSGVVPGATFTITGSVMRIAFTSPPPALDGNSVLITYTVDALVQLGSLAPLT